MPEAAIASLRSFIRPRESHERCDSCGSGLSREHQHTFEPQSRRIRCACETCLHQLRDTHLLIPRGVRFLPDFELSDSQWDDLLIPISLAFFSYSTPLKRFVALYPSPAGAAESLLPLDSWNSIVEVNPELQSLQPDVQALLVNRVANRQEYFIAPIDECYKLVGLLRLHWRGLSGGPIVWGEIAQFFEQLRRKGDACQA